MKFFSGRMRLVGCILGLSLLVTVIAVMGLAAWLGANVYQQALALKATAAEIRALQASRDTGRAFGEGPALIQRLDSQVQALRADLSPFYPLLRLGDLLPGPGEALAQVEPVLEYSAHTAAAARLYADFAARALSEMNAPNPAVGMDLNHQVFGLLMEFQAPAAAAQKELEEADHWRQQVNAAALPDWVQDNLGEMDQAAGLLQKSLPILQLTPALFGAGTPQTYLLAIQNRDELRPTGGFITDFGLLRLDAGNISLLEFQDSTQLTDWTARVIEPPKAIRDIMMAPYLVPRDANWSPDFPTAARQIQELYALSTEIQADGVIAFDQSAVVEVLDLIGPVTVDSETVDAGNVVSYMVEQKSEALAAGEGLKRKEFIADLGFVLVERLLSMREPAQLVELARLFRSMVETGRLNLYLQNPSAQQVLAAYGWSGAVQTGSGDYLLTVDANVGFNKLDRLVEKSTVYTVDLSNPAAPTAQVQLLYKNPTAGSESCRLDRVNAASQGQYVFPACYWTYWRVYSPGGTRVTSAAVTPLRPEDLVENQRWDGELEIGPAEGGSTAAGGMAVIHPNETQSVQLNLALPVAVVQDSGDRRVYRLRVQKQAGVDALNLLVGIRPPVGMQLESPQESWLFDSQSGQWFWKGRITQTIELVVVFSAAE